MWSSSTIVRSVRRLILLASIPARRKMEAKCSKPRSARISWTVSLGSLMSCASGPFLSAGYRYGKRLLIRLISGGMAEISAFATLPNSGTSPKGDMGRAWRTRSRPSQLRVTKSSPLSRLAPAKPCTPGPWR
eukprot:scaffold868_cov249-Pinguiococcus_pyrenoidosus.AAC.5